MRTHIFTIRDRAWCVKICSRISGRHAPASNFCSPQARRPLLSTCTYMFAQQDRGLLNEKLQQDINELKKELEHLKISRGEQIQ
eukprot:scaffold114035_cov13-Tisochrysis_lutea.AAC.1